MKCYKIDEEWDKVVNMLIGEYTHTIDNKNRLSLPSRFRKVLGKKVVVTRGLDNCLFVYSAGEWKTISEKVSSLGMGHAETRAFARFMLAGATEAEVDSLGRVLIPDYLKQFAGLEDKAICAGVSNRVELWNEARWKTYTSKIQGEADAMAERLGDVGMI